MGFLRVVFLSDKRYKSKIKKIAQDAELKLKLLVVENLKELEQAFLNKQDLLLSFGTNVIVGEKILNNENLLSLNVHAAPPEYPGRDPHHFAIYDGVKEYGATLHVMKKKVDSGPIIEVKRFKVLPYDTPNKILTRANEASWILIKNLFKKISSGKKLMPLHNISWGKRITNRKMFLEMCKLDVKISEQEFRRRLKAFSAEGYNNIYIDMYGYKFFIKAEL